jgi:hypothetical protein
MVTTDLIAVLTDLITVLSIFGSLWFGLYQYSQAQRWKRAEFAAQQYKEFSSKPEVKNAFMILDWPSSRPIELLPGTRADITDDLLREALEPKDLGLTESSELHIAIRECFDQFLDGLDLFYYHIKADLVTKDEFYPYMEYLLSLLVRSRPRSKIRNP